jgi:hypothetical protein
VSASSLKSERSDKTLGRGNLGEKGISGEVCGSWSIESDMEGFLMMAYENIDWGLGTACEDRKIGAQK